MPIDQDGSWIQGTKEKGERPQKEQVGIRDGSPPSPYQGQVHPRPAAVANCTTHWEWTPQGDQSRRGEERGRSFTLTGTSRPILSPSDHTGEPTGSETFSRLGSPRGRPPKGQKGEGQGGQDPSEGQEGKALSLLSQGSPASSPWGFLPPPRSHLSSPGRTSVGPPKKSPKKFRKCPSPAEVPHLGHQMWGEPTGWRPGVWAVKGLTSAEARREKLAAYTVWEQPRRDHLRVSAFLKTHFICN